MKSWIKMILLGALFLPLFGFSFVEFDASIEASSTYNDTMDRPMPYLPDPWPYDEESIYETSMDIISSIPPAPTPPGSIP